MPAAFRATFSDMKLVKTRQVAQLIFEIPLSDFDAAYEVLGGMPNPANERWFAVAALQVPPAEKETSTKAPHDSNPTTLRPELDKAPAGAKRNWHDVQPAAQAGIRCAEPIFHAFLNETRKYQVSTPEEAAEAVREICGVHSRVELGTKHAARMLWKQLDDQFAAWKAMENA
jgi:hypothetical protein